MGKKKITLNPKYKTKFLLTIVLCAVMIPLILGWLIVRDKKPVKPVVETAETQTSEVSPGEAPVTEPAPDAVPDEPAAPPETTNAPNKKAIVVGPADENWQLTIVNLTYRLPDGYVPALAPAIEGSSVSLDARITAAFAQMYAAAKASDCVLTPYAGYHSFSAQESTYNRKVNYYLNQGLSQEEAIAKTQQRILPAGCSESNAGLAIDIVSASSDFVNTKEYQWLVANAQEYGFILRYPEDKQDKTGIVFEPWHWRYVGVSAAKEMKQSGKCLEEYLNLV